MEKLDFKYSSKEAWSLLCRLDPNTTRTKDIPKIKPDEFANRIVEMTTATMDKETARKITTEAFNCGHKAQTIRHIVTEYLIRTFRDTMRDIHLAKEEVVEWMD